MNKTYKWQYLLPALFLPISNYQPTYQPNILRFYAEELLAPRQTSKLEDNPLTAVSNGFFNTIPATLRIWTPCLSATWGRAVLWWKGPLYHDIPVNNDVSENLCGTNYNKC
jgi:hypothetical protein